MIKKDLNDTKYSYTLLRFIKLIKRSLESKVKDITTAEYSHRNCTIETDYAANVAEFKETSQITCNTIDMRTKYCQKQPMFSKIGCWVLIRK